MFFPESTGRWTTWQLTFSTPFSTPFSGDAHVSINYVSKINDGYENCSQGVVQRHKLATKTFDDGALVVIDIH